jgi:hypothetical protein
MNEAGDTAVIATAPPIVAEDERRPHTNPLDNVTPERPRTHPIAYAALALATLALLLSLFGLRDNDDGFHQVRVGNADCVIGQQDGTDVLYCRASGVPAP